jgi:DNA-binding MarR family transcriptional regulator
VNRAQTSRDVADLFLQLGAIARQRFVAVALESDLTPPQMGALMALDDHAPMSHLASELGCDPSNVTWMTDCLEERGLVERHTNPDDRRVKHLVLTEAGRRLRKKVERRISDVPGLDRLSGEEQQQLARLLERLLDDA